MTLRTPTPLFLALALGTLAAPAASISVNFSENDDNQVFAGGQNIGPLNTNSSNWNNTSPAAGRTGSLGTGSLNTALKDDTGAVTTATLSWSSSNAYYNDEDGTGSDQAKLAVGYLDDGDAGFSITIANVPYAQYRVYGLLSSDGADGAATTYTTADYTVNGSLLFGSTLTAYGSITDSQAAEGAAWTLLAPGNVGNYWVSATQTNSTLTITGVRNGDARASISGLIIEQIPEPSVALLGGLGLAGLLRRRRA